MGVHRNRRPRWNTSIKNSDSIVFEEDRWNPGAATMASRSSGQGQAGDVVPLVKENDLFGPTSPFDDTPMASTVCPR